MNSDSDTGGHPFPGLRPFDPDEDHLFFGRERATDDLLRKLRRRRFLGVVGSSGSGKSSLVRTGLIPALQGGFMVGGGSHWRIALFRPGSDPIGHLADVLSAPEILGGKGDLGPAGRMLHVAALRRSRMGFVDSVRYARLPAHENLLVVVDQFEELFRFRRTGRRTDARDDAIAFVQLILTAANQEAVPIYVVMTMRSDFIGDCMEYPGLPQAINEGQYLVPRMTREELRTAITGPVAVGGGTITGRLVMRLLNDMGDDPDQLPVLQHALMRTRDYWKARARPGEPLDLPHYEAIGGMDQALDLHATEAYLELHDDRQRRIAERLFKALTEVGSGAHGVRRPIRLSEACEVAEAEAEEVARVVDVFRALGRTFLTPYTGTLDADTVIDLSHESLMRIWARLRAWLNEEAEDAKQYRELAEAAEGYEAGRKDLLRDPELELSLKWWQRAGPTAAWAARYDKAFERTRHFLQLSRERRQRERRRKRILVWSIASLLVLATLVSLAFAVIAQRARQRAESERQQADLAREAAIEARFEAVAQRDRAEQQQWRAERQRSLAENEKQRADQETARAEASAASAEAARLRAEAEQREADRQRANAVEARQDAVAARDLAEQETRRAETSQQRAERLRRLAVARELAARSVQILSEKRSKTAALLAVEAYLLHRDHGGRFEDAAIFGALRQALEQISEGSDRLVHPAPVRAVALDPEGGRLATGCEDGTLRVYTLTANGAILAAEGRLAPAGELPSSVRALAWASESELVAAGSLDGSIWLWDPGRPGEPARHLGAHRGTVVRALADLPERGLLFSGGGDGSLLAWDLSVSGPPTEQSTSLESIQALVRVAARDGREGPWLAASGHSGVRIWNFRRAGAPPAKACDGSAVTALSVHAEGAAVACGTADGKVRIEGGGNWPRELAAHESAVTVVELRGEEQLVTGSTDGTVKIWSLSAERAGEPPVMIPALGLWIWDGAMRGLDDLFTASGDRSVRRLALSSGLLARRICDRLKARLSAEEWREFLPEDLAYREGCAQSP